jgi:alanine racemase
VHHEAQLRAIEQLRPSGPLLQAWLKIDTGMNRAGFPTTQANSAHARLRNCAAVAGITLMTHFSRADELDVDTTERQISRFDACTAGIDGPRSLCNSAGLLAWPHGRRDWGRCGIALYGADPLAAKGGSPEGLQPVMTLKSRVFATKQLRAGDALGYGEGFIADRPMRVGLVAVGYADGYPRSAQTGTPVNVDGEPTRLVGRVSMDMLSIDLTDLPQTGIGSEVELWGQQVDVNAVAQCAGTIAYEVLCNVKRVDRVYLDESQ